MTAIVTGLVFILIGAWGVAHWFRDLLVIVRGFVPVSLVIGGIVALVAGVSALQSDRNDDAAKK